MSTHRIIELDPIVVWALVTSAGVDVWTIWDCTRTLA